MSLGNERMLADIMETGLSRRKASSGCRKLTLPPKWWVWCWGEGVLRKRTQQVSNNVRSEVRSRDLGLRTTYFQGEVRLGGYTSCPSKLSGKGFDKSDQNKPWGSPIFEERKQRPCRKQGKVLRKREETRVGLESWRPERRKCQTRWGHCAQVPQGGQGKEKQEKIHWSLQRKPLWPLRGNYPRSRACLCRAEVESDVGRDAADSNHLLEMSGDKREENPMVAWGNSEQRKF